MEKEKINSEAFRLALIVVHMCYPKIVNEDTVNPEGLSKVKLRIPDSELVSLAAYVKEDCKKDCLKAVQMIAKQFNITNLIKEK